MKRLFLALCLLALPVQAQVITPSYYSGSGGGALSNLGTSPTANNPQIPGDATAGFYSAGVGKVDIAIGGVKMGEWTAGGFYSPLAVSVGSSQYFQVYAHSSLASNVDGNWTLYNNALNGFTRLNFGGNTSSFPALQVNGTGLNAELADGSGLTSFNASLLNIGTPVLSDTGVALQATGSINGYYQSILQNTSNGTAAESDSCFGNDNMTAGGYQLCIGRNSSGYTGTGSFNLANAGFVWSNNGDLTLGTSSNNAIHFVINNGATDVLTIPIGGDLQLAGTIPTASAGTITTGSTSNKGSITGLSAATSVTITFAANAALSTAPSCTATGSVALVSPSISSISTTTVTFAMTAFTGTLYYNCF